jgi:hypothetical protein
MLSSTTTIQEIRVNFLMEMLLILHMTIMIQLQIVHFVLNNNEPITD